MVTISGSGSELLGIVAGCLGYGCGNAGGFDLFARASVLPSLPAFFSQGPGLQGLQAQRSMFMGNALIGLV